MTNDISRLDSRDVYEKGFASIRAKLETRFYSSMAEFSADLAHILSSELGVEPANTLQLQEQMTGRPQDMSIEVREKRKLAKRIIKAVQPAIDDAFRKESELSGRPFEKQMKDLDLMLESGIFSRRDSVALSGDGGHGPTQMASRDAPNEPVLVNGDVPEIEAPDNHSLGKDADVKVGNKLPAINGKVSVPEKDQSPIDEPMNDLTMRDASLDDAEALERAESIAQLHGELSADTEMILASHTPPASTDGLKKTVDKVKLPRKVHDIEPPTPPMSFEGNQQANLSSGGIMWYVEQFDPVGTTVHEERWTGPDVLRAMSEELSEMGDEELHEMGVDSFDYNGAVSESADVIVGTVKKTPGNAKKNGKAKRRFRGFR